MDELQRRINIEAVSLQYRGRTPDGCYIVNTEADYKMLLESKAEFVHVERRGNRAYVWTKPYTLAEPRQFSEEHKRKLRASKAGAHNRRTFENAVAEPFYLPRRNFAIACDVLDGQFYRAVGRKNDISPERVRQIFSKWLRELRYDWDFGGDEFSRDLPDLRSDAWFLKNLGYQKLGRKIPRVKK